MQKGAQELLAQLPEAPNCGFLLGVLPCDFLELENLVDSNGLVCLDQTSNDFFPVFFQSPKAPDLKNVVLARQKNAELGTISNATEDLFCLGGASF